MVPAELGDDEDGMVGSNFPSVDMDMRVDGVLLEHGNRGRVVSPRFNSAITHFEKLKKICTMKNRKGIESFKKKEMDT